MMEIKYREVTDEAWSRRALETFEVRLELPDVVVTGPCPRCRHNMQHIESVMSVHGITAVTPEQARAMWDALRSTKGAPEVMDVEFTVFCECRIEHPETLEGKKGCGAYWAMRARLENPDL